jgi:phosphopantetheinyl transferase (holo-ACP synthase)
VTGGVGIDLLEIEISLTHSRAYAAAVAVRS